MLWLPDAPNVLCLCCYTPGLQSPRLLSGHPRLMPGHDGPGAGVVAESVLGTDCSGMRPTLPPTLPCRIQASARYLAQGPDLGRRWGSCAESGTGLVSGSVSLTLSLCVSLFISLSFSLFPFLSLSLSLCFTLSAYLCSWLSSLSCALSFQCVFFSPCLFQFVFTLISLCLCFPVFLPVCVARLPTCQPLSAW